MPYTPGGASGGSREHLRTTERTKRSEEMLQGHSPRGSLTYQARLLGAKHNLDGVGSQGSGGTADCKSQGRISVFNKQRVIHNSQTRKQSKYLLTAEERKCDLYIT